MSAPRLACLALIAATALSGCVAKTVYNVATAPVRVGSRAVDLATTSQSEADEKRGRDMRRREEQLGKLQRRYERHLRDCNSGNEDACLQARSDYAQLEEASVGGGPARRN